MSYVFDGKIINVNPNDIKFKFKHLYKNQLRNGELSDIITYAFKKEQIKSHINYIFKNILETEVVTVCSAYDRLGNFVGQGFSFCRGDRFNKKIGKIISENRIRAQIGIELLPSNEKT
jgi:hypothetical protein